MLPLLYQAYGMGIDWASIFPHGFDAPFTNNCAGLTPFYHPANLFCRSKMNELGVVTTVGIRTHSPKNAQNIFGKRAVLSINDYNRR